MKLGDLICSTESKICVYSSFENWQNFVDVKVFEKETIGIGIFLDEMIEWKSWTCIKIFINGKIGFSNKGSFKKI